MKKNIIFIFLLVLFLSLFNTLYKYTVTMQNISSYNYSFGNAYLTTSNINPPYLKIFILTFMFLIISFVLLLFTLYFLNHKNISIKNIFCNLSNFLPLVISSFLGGIFLFVNKIFSFLVLFIGLFIYLYFTYKKTNNKRMFIVILLWIVMAIYVLYLISS